MDPRGATELVEWAGISLPWRAGDVGARHVVVGALDDFPGQMSAAALLREAPRDVVLGAARLAAAAGGAAPVIVAEAARAKDLEDHRDAAPHVGILVAPALHPLSSPRVLAAWLARHPRFDGSRPEDFAVVTADEAAAVGAAARGQLRLERWITVAGAVREGGTFLVPHGTTVATLLRLAGGRTSESGVPWLASRGALRPAATSFGTGGADSLLIVLAGDGVLSRNRALPLDVALRRIDSVCVRCALCDEACPVATPDSRGRPVGPAALLDALRFADGSGGGPAPPHAAASCLACGVCETICPVGLPVARVAAEVADRLSARGAAPGSVRSASLVPREAMRRRLGLGADPSPSRDARADVRRVRLPLGAAAPVSRVGDRVWRGEVVGRDVATGVRLLASISGIVSRSADALTIRRPREVVS